MFSMFSMFSTTAFRTLFLVCITSAFVFPEIAKAESVSISTLPETLSFSWNDNEHTLAREAIALWFEPKSTVSFRNGMKMEAISPAFCPWELFFCDFSLPAHERSSIRSKTVFTLNETSVRDFLETLRAQSRKDPMDALFAVNEDGAVSAFAPSRDGSEIDVTVGLDALKKALSSSTERNIALALPIRILQPNITSTDADRLGITKFLGEGRTSFAGSPKNRVFNIKRAIEQFQGILIPPGKEFSFVEYLGAVDGEHGYLPELVIKRGQTLPEFGGGICQVSTTLFRAALNTGQKITERRNHAYPVQYYKPYGMDATIYIPKPDFKFINNTPAHILLQVAIEEKELVFRFYGTPDGRTISLDGPHITARTPDGGMKTVFTQKVIAADGTTLIEDTFKSSYESPNKFPHPGEEKLTEKPRNWSEKQWNAYVATGALPR